MFRRKSLFIYICDAPRQNQALLARFRSAQEPKTHGARSNCRKWVNDGIDQRNYPLWVGGAILQSCITDWPCVVGSPTKFTKVKYLLLSIFFNVFTFADIL